jgi:hypothetical protein
MARQYNSILCSLSKLANFVKMFQFYPRLVANPTTNLPAFPVVVAKIRHDIKEKRSEYPLFPALPRPRSPNGHLPFEPFLGELTPYAPN